MRYVGYGWVKLAESCCWHGISLVIFIIIMVTLHLLAKVIEGWKELVSPLNHEI